MKKYFTFIITILLFVMIPFSVIAQEFEELEDYSAINDLDSSDFSNTVQMALSNADYMVTAGDVYSLTYSANGIAVSYTIPVDPTYKIRVSNLAVLDASGKSYITKQYLEDNGNVPVVNYLYTGNFYLDRNYSYHKRWFTKIFESLSIPIAKLFALNGGTDASEIAKAVAFAIRIGASSFVLMGITISIQGMLQAFRDSVRPLILSCLRYAVILLPVIFLFTLTNNPINNIWFAIPITELFTAIVSVFMIIIAFKKTMAKIEE